MPVCILVSSADQNANWSDETALCVQDHLPVDVLISERIEMNTVELAWLNWSLSYQKDGFGVTQPRP